MVLIKIKPTRKSCVFCTLSPSRVKELLVTLLLIFELRIEFVILLARHAGSTAFSYRYYFTSTL